MYTVFSFLCFNYQHLLIVFIESWIEPFQKRKPKADALKKASVEPFISLLCSNNDDRTFYGTYR